MSCKSELAQGLNLLRRPWVVTLAEPIHSDCRRAFGRRFHKKGPSPTWQRLGSAHRYHANADDAANVRAHRRESLRGFEDGRRYSQWTRGHSAPSVARAELRSAIHMHKCREGALAGSSGCLGPAEAVLTSQLTPVAIRPVHVRTFAVSAPRDAASAPFDATPTPLALAAE